MDQSAKQDMEKIIKQCLFCRIAKNEIKSRKIYEDSNLVALLDINPANPGHTIVFPKTHYTFWTLMPQKEIGIFFEKVKMISAIVQDSLKAEGTNILISNGFIAGQRAPHFIVHIIPRFKDDGLNFEWEPKKLKEEELNKIEFLLKEQITQILSELQNLKQSKEASNLKKEEKETRYEINKRLP